MPGSFRQANMPELPVDLHTSLLPYVSILEEVLIPVVRRSRKLPKPGRSLERIKRRINEFITQHFGHSVHTAIVCFGLRVCCHEYMQAIEGGDRIDTEHAPFKLIDRVYELVQSFAQYCGADDYFLLEL